MTTFIDRLSAHRPRLDRARLCRWALADPILEAPGVDDLVARCRAGGAGGNATLAAVLALAATDSLAGEVALVALAPVLGRVARTVAGDPEEAAAVVVAEAWAVIAAWDGGHGPWPATRICDLVADRLRTRARAQRRVEGCTTPLSGDLEAPPVAGVAGVLEDWVAAGRLAPQEASLIRATRVDGRTLAEVARERGERHDVVRRRRARAERALRAAA